MSVAGRGRAAARFERTVLRENRRASRTTRSSRCAAVVAPARGGLDARGRDAGGEFPDLAETYLTPEGQRLIADAVSNSAGEAGASALGMAVLIWGALRVFRATNIAFARIYRATRDQSLLDQFRSGVVVLLAIGLALVVMTATSAAGRSSGTCPISTRSVRWR